jgi:hypothetical protein
MAIFFKYLFLRTRQKVIRPERSIRSGDRTFFTRVLGFLAFTLPLGYFFFFLSFFLHITCLIYVLLRKIIQQTQFMKVKLPCNMLPSASALEGGTWSTSRPDRLIPMKETRCLFYRSLDWPRGQKILPAPGVEPITYQPVASRYTDCAIQHSNSIHAMYKTLIRSTRCYSNSST